jgi:hypothetical protein
LARLGFDAADTALYDAATSQRREDGYGYHSRHRG